MLSLFFGVFSGALEFARQCPGIRGRKHQSGTHLQAGRERPDEKPGWKLQSTCGCPSVPRLPLTSTPAQSVARSGTTSTASGDNSSSGRDMRSGYIAAGKTAAPPGPALISAAWESDPAKRFLGKALANPDNRPPHVFTRWPAELRFEI